MKFEPEKYLSLMEKVDLPVSQKEEMLRTVWGIIESQVDQAFNMHPVQICQNNQKSLSNTTHNTLESIEMTTVSSFNQVSANDGAYRRKA